MLVVTTIVGVINGVSCDTTNLGPLVALGPVLVAGVAGLGDGLVHTASTGDDADHGTAVRVHGLARAGGELDTGHGFIIDMRNSRDEIPNRNKTSPALATNDFECHVTAWLHS